MADMDWWTSACAPILKLLDSADPPIYIRQKTIYYNLQKRGVNYSKSYVADSVRRLAKHGYLDTYTPPDRQHPLYAISKKGSNLVRSGL
jgi:hypothetical protein